MKLTFWRSKYLDPAARAPVEVRAELLDSMYAPVLSLIIASAAGILVTLVAADRARLPALTFCAGLLGVVFVARLAAIWLYRRRDPAKANDPQAVAYWELVYALGAYAFAATLSAIGVVAMIDTNDAVSHMLIYTVNMALMAGAATRNSGMRQVALWQILLALAPVGVAALWRGEFAYYVLGGVTLLYCVAGIEICLYQSANALRMLNARREKTVLVHQLEEKNTRFDAALNNMPQGLCMFSADRHLAVVNSSMRKVFGAPQLSLEPGLTIEQFADHFLRAGAFSAENALQAMLDIHRNLAAQRPAMSFFALPNGRIIATSQAPLEDGGAVLLYDDVTERHQAEARVRYLATHDTLTGLPNRTLFNQLLRDEIEDSEVAHRQFCVLFIDLDRFKAINDTLGHAAGDALLREVSGRLEDCLRKGDVAARLGGDEFVAIIRDVRAQQDAATIAEAVLARLNASMNICGQECGVTASIGVALYPVDGADEDTLLKNADAAMYLAKSEGKSGVRMFSSKVKTQTLEGLMLETSMRHALERDEFLVVYQPMRDVATGALTGVEALLRWRHPELGMLPPDRFIPIAEQTGLIVPIGKWVLETACKAHMTWRAAGLPPLAVAVNLSPRQLYDDRLLGDLADALAHSGMEPEWLELEITESMVMQDAGDAIMVLRAVKEMGVRLAIDDFGTGYSSLSLVKQMPLDTIKIDRSFINDLLTDPNDRAIAEAVISLGHALKLRVVAEGVETEAQEAFLRERGCGEMQGYLFSRPLEADTLLSFAADYNLSQLRALGARERAAVKKSA